MAVTVDHARVRSRLAELQARAADPACSTRAADQVEIDQLLGLVVVSGLDRRAVLDELELAPACGTYAVASIAGRAGVHRSVVRAMLADGTLSRVKDGSIYAPGEAP